MKKYSIGLDIGTNSVGWAVIDENNELVRYKKKNMWGARLFDEAQKAEGRRVNRSSRRRLKRRNQRIKFLQDIFKQSVLKVDDGFFIKMKESILHKEDKTINPLKSSLTEIGYYDYPTIYHLRQELIDNPEQKDIRLVYLAIHHIIKYRGNFLYQGEFNIDNLENITNDIEYVFNFIEEKFNYDCSQIISKTEKIAEILKQKESRSTRQSEILSLFNFEKEEKTFYKNIFGAILGLKINLAKIFSEIEKKEFKLSKGDYQDKRTDYESLLGDNIELLDLFEKIYSWIILQGVLFGQNNISQAMINKYDQYTKDLKTVKKIFKENLTNKEYKEFFKSKPDNKGNLTGYTKYTESGYKYDEFLKDFNKIFKKVESKLDKNDPEIKRILKRIEDKEIFSKNRISDNGAIPHQLHKDELVKIIENQGKYYPELLNKVDNGDGKQEYKIVRLLEHRIPYYIGPLLTNDKKKHDFGWMKRAESGDITPFNFYQKVDKMGSAEAFINNLTNNCTYLPLETVLPKKSLLISEFTVRNEIKNIKINGNHPNIDLENKIFNELFKKQKSVSKKSLIKFLQNDFFPTINNNKIEVNGLSKITSFTSNMGSLIDFKNIGIDVTELETYSDNYKMVENIIKWIVIFEDKDILKEKIKKEYGDNLSEKQIEKIAKLNYSGWSSLSEKLLIGIKNEKNESILDNMRDYEENFMQIISNEKFGFNSKLKQALDKYMENIEGDNYDSLVKNIPASPGIKRGIWQSKLLIDEIIHLMDNQKPEKIYIEMPRGASDNGRTKSRKKQLEDLYQKIAINGNYFTIEDKKRFREELNQFEKIDQDSSFLYFNQGGKCAYSGQAINLNDIDKTCEVEHILPRSLIKDNSFDNKILVIRKFNQDKGDRYPINPEIVKKQIGLWKYWLDNDVISLKKFANLTKTQQKYDQEKASGGFIARQLVETRQIIKHVETLFNSYYKTDNQISIVEPVKARINSEFRNKFNFPKSRTINDFHHAKDAYLTAVLGKYLAQKFPDRKRKNLYERYMKFSDQSRKQREDKELSFVLHKAIEDFTNKNTGEIDIENSIIAKTMKYNDCLVTRKTETNDDGQLFNLTIYKHQNKANSKIARKEGFDVAKYGGHTSDKMAYMAAVKIIDKKNKEKKVLIKIPLRIAIKANHNLTKIEELLVKEMDLKSLKIIKNKIPKNQIIKTKDDSLLMLISQADAGNAKQLRLPYKIEQKYIILSKIITKEDSLKNNKNIKKLYYRFPEYVDQVGEKDNYQYNLKSNAVEEINQFLNSFYDILLNKIQNNIKFYGNKMIQKVIDFQVVFNQNQKIFDKITFLNEMLILTDCSARYAKFETLDISKEYFKSGTGAITMKTFNLNEIEFYNYSITGLKIKKTIYR